MEVNKKSMSKKDRDDLLAFSAAMSESASNKASHLKLMVAILIVFEIISLLVTIFL